MHDVFGFRHALILLLEDAGAALRVVASRGYSDPPAVARKKKMMRVGNLPQKRAYADAIRRQIEQTGDPGGLSPAPTLPGLPDAESQVAIPLLIEDRLVGVFSVECTERHVFTERDETLLAIVANLCASAIHNAQAFRREEQRRENLEGTVGARTLEASGAHAEVQAPAFGLDEIVGDSPAMDVLRALVRKILKSPASTILVTGANGTGKDLLAKVLHYQGPRAAAPFMNITCSALAENLLESELFGHERGAFTDAHKQKKGLLELADGGTVFLDEIGEMGPSLQAKLLRFLEEKSFKRVGGSEDIRVDVRIVAATNRDLQRMVREGRFREDLFYRLRVVPIELPPLKERAGDVPRLARLFLHRFAQEFGKPVEDLTPEALAALDAYDWPGNVRELRNAVERAVLLGEGPVLTAEDFRLPRSTEESGTLRLAPTGLGFEELERSLVRQALEMSGWNKAQAARLLGMPRDWLRYRIEKHGLTPPDEA
jgi:two-component system, NtrC family, response regulator AtoC